MIANKHTTLFDGGVANQITTPLQVVADDDTQEVQLLNLYPDMSESLSYSRFPTATQKRSCNT